MRPLAVLFFAALLFCSCSEHRPKKLSRFDSIPAFDTNCRKDVDLARADLARGKLTYCRYMGMLTGSFRNKDEFIAELRKYNISYRDQLVSDYITDQPELCYCDLMRDAIDERYGHNFIDTLKNVSDSLFLAANIDSTFSYLDCDTWAHYPNDPDSSKNDQSAIFQEQFDSRIKYPKGYIKRPGPNKGGLVDIGFLVTKGGEARVVGYTFSVENHNDKYTGFFKRQIEAFAPKHGWKPAEIRGQKVSCLQNLRLFFD